MEEPTVLKTRSSRVTRDPNRRNPTMTGKSHGNSRDVGGNFPLVGRSNSDYDGDHIACQYAGAGYTTKQGFAYFNVDEHAPPPKVMTK